MSDAEIRGGLLEHFHRLRHNNGGWVPISETILAPAPVRLQVIGGVCQQLAEIGLIQWKPLQGPSGVEAGMAKITGKGVAAVEALSSSEIDIRFPSMAQAERAEFPPHALWNKEQGGTSVDIKQIEPETMKLAKALLHSAIIASCEGLLQSKHYAQAVELSFKVVRDRLRELTGHEKGSDAFGKGRLYIKGAIAPHVDRDFNEGVKFLTMAIDMFRNEKSHTSEIGINELEKALQYLILSSLAMRLLDDAEIRSSLFSNGQ